MSVWRFKNQNNEGTLLDQVLAARGLAGAPGADLPRADKIPGSDEAVRIVKRAIDDHIKIAVFGDYDCDGIAGAIIMSRILERSGADVIVRLPCRHEGYGIKPQHVKELAERGVGLIITVDNGITGFDAARAAKESGIQMVVTDHHEPKRELPDCPVVDPKLSEGFKHYSGAGVAWLFGSYLCRAKGLHPPDDLLDLAALATVVDVAPITGPNFALARRGLMRMRDKPSPGIKALMDVAGTKEIGGWSMMWQLGPRINAAGRMDDPMLALRLLRSEDIREASVLARELDLLNRDRRSAVDTVVNDCLKRYDGSCFPVFVGDYPHGVVGVAAGRLAEDLRRPVLVGALEGNAVRASGRSIGEFDILAALEQCKGLVHSFGGHKKACGVSFDPRNARALQEALSSVAAKSLSPADIVQWVDIDGVIRKCPTPDEIRELDVLEPFGEANPEPVFAVAGRIEQVRRGESWQQVTVRGIKFFVPPEYPIGDGKVVHAAITPVVDEYGGGCSVAARVADIRDFSLTREALISAYSAWLKNESIDARAESVFAELGLRKDGRNSKKDLLQSPTFQEYGIVQF